MRRQGLFRRVGSGKHGDQIERVRGQPSFSAGAGVLYPTLRVPPTSTGNREIRGRGKKRRNDNKTLAENDVADLWDVIGRRRRVKILGME
jgi:hypothetical protein